MPHDILGPSPLRAQAGIHEVPSVTQCHVRPRRPPTISPAEQSDTQHAAERVSGGTRGRGLAGGVQRGSGSPNNDGSGLGDGVLMVREGGAK